jgi:regulator of sigma E protease
MEHLSNAFSIFLLVIGFGFVIFWHELGHFLAAKWVGIKVEQFAVGMGHALVSFRKGIGWKLGNTRSEYERRVKEHLAKKLDKAPTEEFTDKEMSDAGEELGLGETEYRLSWIPVGGYVKMLGQDDMKPGADADDPRAFNKKTIPQRMLVVSAGVVMNIILAALLFMGLFMMGFHAPAPVVGMVKPGSPAQHAKIQPGDTILSFNGQPMHDFTKITLATALASTEEPLRVSIQRYETRAVETVDVQPVRQAGSSKSFLALGIGSAPSLQGLSRKDYPDQIDENLVPPSTFVLKPDDVITQVNGIDVGLYDYAKLDRAVQDSHGQPIALTVRRKDGKVESVQLKPHFDTLFGTQQNDLNIAGLQPRMRVEQILDKNSPAYKTLMPGDAVVRLGVRNASTPSTQPAVLVAQVSVPAFVEQINDAGQKGQSVEVTVIRDGVEKTLREIKPTLKIEDHYKLGVAPAYDDEHPVVGGILEKSAAANAPDGISPGSVIQKVDGKLVRNWFDIRDALKDAKPGNHVLTLLPPASQTSVERTLNLSDGDISAIADIRLEVPLALGEWTIERKTSSPAVAIGWGVLETRDLILQFYVTLQRMFGGSISASNLMGPVGIVQAGSRFAFKGNDWLVWFLAMISANLAVVNFLPIPIVDGGLFLFLIIEKIQGKPLSRRAQEYAQLVGLALILSVFLMVTYNDIARMFGR